MFPSIQSGARAPSLGHFDGAASGRERVIDARRCTVQLSTGRLYLDVAATSETALLGHDRPTAVPVDEAAVRKALTSLSPGYVCIALRGSSETAKRLALRLGESATRRARRTQVANALLGEPPSGSGGVIALENETLGRTGGWLASATWRRRPEFIVVGEALALGRPFGALLAKESVMESLSRGTRPKHATPIDKATLSQVAATIAMVEREGLLEHGSRLAEYLRLRLDSVRMACPEVVTLTMAGLSIKIDFAPPLSALKIRRKLCERGVLAGVDDCGRLIVDPPLPLRLAEVDVITGALRGVLLGSPAPSALACCAGCEDEPFEFVCEER